MQKPSLVTTTEMFETSGRLNEEDILFINEDDELAKIFNMQKEEVREISYPFKDMQLNSFIILGNNKVLAYDCETNEMNLWDAAKNEVKSINFYCGLKKFTYQNFTVDSDKKFAYIILNDHDSGASGGFDWEENEFALVIFDITNEKIISYFPLGADYLPTMSMISFMDDTCITAGQPSMIKLTQVEDEYQRSDVMKIDNREDQFQIFGRFDTENILYAKEETERRSENNYVSENTTTLFTYNLATNVHSKVAQYTDAYINQIDGLILDDKRAVIFECLKDKYLMANLLDLTTLQKVAYCEFDLDLTYINSHRYQDWIYIVNGVTKDYKNNSNIYKFSI